MRQFYKQVQVDETKMRFYAECPLCKKRKYAARLPLLCRQKEQLELFEQGKEGEIRQRIYNKSKIFAVRRLIRWFNLCRECEKWVCDDCFDSNAGYGTCRSCIAKDHQQ